ncbi:MAG: N-acetylglucosamine kinase [Rhizobiales bacterium]|nr:N-acetylglucosamine kinase [Hyphomicrobiales bacterium]MBI3673039.1 N-acetylglucosamine kinase [Hyphomicrobiales bacterium]
MIQGGQVFLGIDGGGSRCRARIRDGAGVLRGEAVGGSSNIYQNFDGAIASIVATAAQAAAQANVPTTELHAGLGLAGIVTSVGAERIEAAKLPFASVIADNDAYAAQVGAFGGGDGGIVIAGTGSIGFAVIGGARHMVGGWGFALGDHGSGAWLGHHAVRRAALAIDGLLQPTPLIDNVLRQVGATRFDLSRWSEKAVPADYARMAPLVFDCAAKGDVHGMTIVIEGAAAISNLGRALLARGAARLSLLGGLAQVYPPYLDADVKRALTPPEADAMDGAIMMARKARGLAERWS